MLRVALTHYAPVPDTFVGEPPEIYRYPSTGMAKSSTRPEPTWPSMATLTSEPSVVQHQQKYQCATSPDPSPPALRSITYK
jgi:hypothetical protein